MQTLAQCFSATLERDERQDHWASNIRRGAILDLEGEGPVNEQVVGEALSTLRIACPGILSRLFRPVPLVQAGVSIAESPNLKEKFDAAGVLFRERLFDDAAFSFLELEREAENLHPGDGRTALFNAASCATGSGSFASVVSMLEPLMDSGRLYGFPAWNLAVAYERLGQVRDAIKAVRVWVERAPTPRQARGQLVAACLALIAKDDDLARSYLETAIDADVELVSSQLGVPLRTLAADDLSEERAADADPVGSMSAGVMYRDAPLPDPMAPPVEIAPAVGSRASDAANQNGELAEAVHQRLVQLLVPKRPERSPTLLTYLNSRDVELFDDALEAMAERDQQRAADALADIITRNPEPGPAHLALAACALFLGQDLRAQSLLREVERSGAALPSAALWNLACAEIRLNDIPNARRALAACALTEYRTKPELWIAMEALKVETSITRPRAPSAPSARLGSPLADLTADLPASSSAAALEMLRRLLAPRRLPRAYRPDLGRLTEADRRSVEPVLDAALASFSRESVDMLAPLVRRHPGVYTIKIHAAALALARGELDRAREWLSEAEGLRSLDATSSINFAYVHVIDGHLQDAADVLGRARQSALGKQPTYWLMLALALQAAGSSEAETAAGQALVLSGKDPRTADTIKDALQLAGILAKPTDAAEPDPIVSAALRTISHLESGDLATASRDLETVVRALLPTLPELDPSVAEPQFERKPSENWQADVTRSFKSAVADYDDGQFRRAGGAFRRLYNRERLQGAALNGSAALIKAGDFEAAEKLVGDALRRERRPRRSDHQSIQPRRRRRSWGWRLAYNGALSSKERGQARVGATTIDQYLRGRSGEEVGTLPSLLVSLASASNDEPSSRILITGLELLMESGRAPSREILLTSAWARLSIGDVGEGRKLVEDVIQTAEGSKLEPPAQLRSPTQVRAAYEYLIRSRATVEIVDYFAATVRAREAERARDLAPRQFEQCLGTEIAARALLVGIYAMLGERESSMQVLDEAETLLLESAERVAPGLLRRNWAELAEAARQVDLTWAASRFIQAGTTIDPDNIALRELAIKVAQLAEPATRETLLLEATRLNNVPSDESIDRVDVCRALVVAIAQAPTVNSVAPVLMGLLSNSLRNLEAGEVDPAEVEDVCDRARFIARIELPADVGREIHPVLDWIMRSFATNDGPVEVEVDVHEGILWPRGDDSEGACILAVTGRADHDSIVTLWDDHTNSEIWKGTVAPGRTSFVRWVIKRDEGFAAGDWLDPSVSVGFDDRSLTQQAALSVSVADRDPIWPQYPTGALSPDDVRYGELYGRRDLIRRIVSAFGDSRAQSAFLVEAPRQMGKTSLLYFLLQEMPKHVLPVYVNLELKWSSDDGGNVWAFLISRLNDVTGSQAAPAVEQPQAEDLIRLTKSICQGLGKKYIVFLLDEFHALFDKSSEASSVLSALREFHNNASNQIAILLADRYTHEELEARLDHEFWAQLTPLALGPLDRSATAKALRTPAEDSDVVFLDETVEHMWTLTGGYPYHVQRATRYLLEAMIEGPWLVAAPTDLAEVDRRMTDEDRLFQIGLCRPDRIDGELEDAISAFLEWRDLLSLLPVLRTEPEWKESVSAWSPDVRDLLAGVGDPDRLLRRLVSVGVLVQRQGSYQLFSPLLETWLGKMRMGGRSLGAADARKAWGVVGGHDGAAAGAEEWQRLDAELAAGCRAARVEQPLLDRSSLPTDWRSLVEKVADRESFRTFLGAFFRLFIDQRENGSAMIRFPWLYLSFHRARLVRNYVEHSANEPTRAAQQAWNNVCLRALTGRVSAAGPTNPNEWRAAQQILLRDMYSALHNSIVLATRSRD